MKRGVGNKVSEVFNMSKKAQVTLFVIIAIVIAVAAVMLYQFSPKVQSVFTGVEKNPERYLEMCIYDDLVETVNKIESQGGYITPPSSYRFDDSNITYLCYTSEYYKTCVNQVPFLKPVIEKELSNALSGKINNCISSLKDDYTEAGYSVSLSEGDFSIKILPSKITLDINRKMTISKGDQKQTYDNFKFDKKSSLYEMLGVTKSIVEFESTIGEANPLDYMLLHNNLKVEKLKQSEGTKIYILTNQETNEKFQFASRSVAYPPGYL